MTTDSPCANLIQRYVRTCGLRFLRGEPDGKYLCVADLRPRRLCVRLEISPSFSDVLAIRVTPAGTFPAVDRPWLTQMADTWNRQNREVTVIVRSSPDPQRTTVVARRNHWIAEGLSFEDFASIADQTIAAAIEFFALLTPVVESALTAQPSRLVSERKAERARVTA